MSAELVTATIDGLAFSRADDGELRIRDIDAAIRAGWKRPRVIRELIRRLQKLGLLPDILMRRTLRRLRNRQGWREVLVEEFWLTKAELMIVMAKSDTAFGGTVLLALVNVWKLAESGLLVPVQQSLSARQGDIIIASLNDIKQCALMHPSGHGVCIGEVPDMRRMAKEALRAAAIANGVDYRTIHGAVRGKFRVSTVNNMPVCQDRALSRYLDGLTINTPINTLARQLSFWPMGAP